MPKKNKTIVWLFPSNALKAKIVIESILEHKRFYDNYNNIFYFDEAKGNAEFIKKEGYGKVLIGGKNLDILKNEKYDYLISCGWGWKIDDNFIKKARIAALNAHSSYLPDYKGCSVYYHYWANLEKNTGATIHLLTDKFDEGNIICQEKVSINIKDTPKDILKKVSYLTSILIREAILLTERGYYGFPQRGGRYFFKISKHKLYFYRHINLLMKMLKLNKRFLTPHKKIEK